MEGCWRLSISTFTSLGAKLFDEQHLAAGATLASRKMLLPWPASTDIYHHRPQHSLRLLGKFGFLHNSTELFLISPIHAQALVEMLFEHTQKTKNKKIKNKFRIEPFTEPCSYDCQHLFNSGVSILFLLRCCIKACKITIVTLKINFIWKQSTLNRKFNISFHSTHQLLSQTGGKLFGQPSIFTPYNCQPSTPFFLSFCTLLKHSPSILSTILRTVLFPLTLDIRKGSSHCLFLTNVICKSILSIILKYMHKLLSTHCTRQQHFKRWNGHMMPLTR